MDYTEISANYTEKAKLLYNDVINCYNFSKEIRQHKFIIAKSQEFIASVGSLYFNIFTLAKISNQCSVDINSGEINIDELFDLILDEVNNLHKLFKEINENNIR